jgi:purine-nucleoside phosphorylase
MIARKYLSNAKVISKHRGLLAYTGKWRNIPVSVFTTGMGCPSAGIVVEEIIRLGVKQMIRIGTCGGVQKEILPGDYVIPDKAIPLVGLLDVYNIKKTAQTPDNRIFKKIVETSVKNKYHIGTICTSDAFYKEVEQARKWKSKGVLAFEMECAGIFALAKLRKVKAGCILTATGNIIYGKQVMETPSIKKSIENMVLIALETIKKIKDEK